MAENGSDVKSGLTLYSGVFIKGEMMDIDTRDYIAIEVMKVLIKENPIEYREIAEKAYRMADIMIEMREVSKDTIGIDLNESLRGKISVRSYNCLKDKGVKTIRDLIYKTEEEIKHGYNLGHKSSKEIKEYLDSVRLELRKE